MHACTCSNEKFVIADIIKYGEYYLTPEHMYKNKNSLIIFQRMLVREQSHSGGGGRWTGDDGDPVSCHPR